MLLIFRQCLAAPFLSSAPFPSLEPRYDNSPIRKPPYTHLRSARTQSGRRGLALPEIPLYAHSVLPFYKSPRPLPHPTPLYRYRLRFQVEPVLTLKTRTTGYRFTPSLSLCALREMSQRHSGLGARTQVSLPTVASFPFERLIHAHFPGVVCVGGGRGGKPGCESSSSAELSLAFPPNPQPATPLSPANLGPAPPTARLPFLTVSPGNLPKSLIWDHSCFIPLLLANSFLLLL